MYLYFSIGKCQPRESALPVDWHTFVRYVGTDVEGLTSSSDICWLLKSHNVLYLVYVWHFSEEIRHPSWTEITFISTWWCDAVILAVNATTELTLHVFAVVIAVRVKDVHTYLYFLPLPPCPLLPNPLFSAPCGRPLHTVTLQHNVTDIR